MKRKRLFMLSIATCMTLGLSTANVFASSISDQNEKGLSTSLTDAGSSIKWTNGTPQFHMVEQLIFEYPDAGKERELGPEKYTYIKHTFDPKGNFLYKEVVREADEVVLERDYPDGTSQKLDVGPVASENAAKFNTKYDPAIIKKEQDEKYKEDTKNYEEQKLRVDQSETVLVSAGEQLENNVSNPSTIVSGNQESFVSKTETNVGTHSASTTTNIFNFTIREMKASSDLPVFLGTQTGTDVNYTNLVENPLGDVTSQAMMIKDKLAQENTPVKLVVTFMPYSCSDYPSGYFYHQLYENTFEILLFNNGSSFVDQFNAQFEKYKKEYKYYLD